MFFDETYISYHNGARFFRKKLSSHVCDECGKFFYKRTKPGDKVALTFCSKSCMKISRSSGALRDKTKQTLLNLWGVETAGEIPGASKKMLQTRIDRFGTVAPIHQHNEISTKWKASNLKKFGTEYPMQSQICKNKFSENFLKNHGVAGPYFANSPFRLSLKQSSAAGQKGYRSLAQKRNGMSSAEANFIEFLTANQIRYETQKLINHSLVDEYQKQWLIDFYLSDLSIFVEIDGIFWHGLNKPYADLHPQIKHTFDKDRIKDNWFNISGLKLIRFTDAELKICKSTNNWELVSARLEG